MSDAHFFSYQKVINGEPSNIWHDVIVRGDYSFRQAKDIAEQEMREMVLGCWALAAVYEHDEDMIEIIRTRKVVLATCEVSKDYKFVEAY